jgi:RecA-family ATPase
MAPFLDVLRAADLQAPSTSSPPWLIEQLWSAHAVGILGGMPKSLKTWMALEMAVAVASGSSCLGQFAVPAAGPVMLYAAEDGPAALRGRLESLVHLRGLRLPDLDVRVIVEDSLRLDRTADQERLEATLILHRPTLLILDPLVRLHAIDESCDTSHDSSHVTSAVM